MHCLFTDGCGAPTAAKPHHEEVTPVAVLRDESEIASSPTELVFSADPALPVAFLTFSRPNGGSDVPWVAQWYPFCLLVGSKLPFPETSANEEP